MVRISLTIRFLVLRSLFFVLLQKVFEGRESPWEESEKDKTDFKRIRCPKCKWQPSASSRWFCSDALEPEFYLAGCGTAWNTFNTRGKCPGCDHVWRWTSCLNCSGWSLHEDWYDNN